MNNNRLIITLLFTMSAIILLLIGFLYNNWQNNHFECESNLIYVSDDGVLDVVSKYSFNNGKGNHESFGSFTTKNQKPLNISYKNSFDYWSENGKTIMVSNVNNEHSKHPEILRAIMPDFYHFRDRVIILEIKPANNLSHYFIYDNAPISYCKKINSN